MLFDVNGKQQRPTILNHLICRHRDSIQFAFLPETAKDAAESAATRIVGTGSIGGLEYWD